MSDSISSMYCLHCRKQQSVKDVKKETTSFKSKKKGTDMARSTWAGVCGVCGTRVRQFAKAAGSLSSTDGPKAPRVATVPSLGGGDD